MSKSRTKNMTPWTEEHDEFCLENHIPPSAKLLWQYLIREGGEGEEIEPDLKEFNDWVKKHRGKGFCRPTLKNALSLLEDLRVVRVVKQFTWAIVRIVTRSLDLLNPKKNLQKRNKNSTFHPSSACISFEGENSSSNTLITEEQLVEHEAVLSECESAGIPFDPMQSPEILGYTLPEVKASLALFKARGGHQTNWRGRPKIANPQGWLLMCLRRRWYHQAEGWQFASLLTALGVEL